ncbi:PfkB family carbohydrate kinase [Bradyrhizobium sp. SSUT18]|uniref:PfkB family carbohydrate kinase n=1 Tax=Bradyrhizobium sp. SSUT18 TaxID=3040602 RepID=UPI00244C2EA8|nr:PfkB family carbohydrate kinase [Bradyrhizobium sp. SSUT18]MDH2398394.1 PfkB family carbohydrate kinase [Bradyrhizobium sp. SSUT18]
MPDFDVATVGDNCMDRYLPPVGLAAIGGNAVNVAIHLRKQGLRTAYFGAVGPDDDGRRMLDCFKDNDLNIAHVQVKEGVTAYTNIDIDKSGDRIIAFEEFGVCRTYRPSEADFKVLLSMRHVHIGWLDDGGELKRRLASAGVSVSQDITVNPGADGLTIAFGSAGADPHAAIDTANGYLTQGAALAVVTRGSMGSIATDGSVVVEAGILPVDVCDTTGAGDTFIAGFIARRLAGGNLQECLAAGRDAAAVTCTHFGGFPQTPYFLV